MTREILHPGWDSSWPTPSAQDVDDLAELGHLRLEPSRNAKRGFAVTAQGRQQAVLLAEPATASSGRAPSATEVLRWLGQVEREAPEVFDIPTRLLDCAVASEFVDQSAREALAERLIQLFQEGYLSGDLPEFDQARAEQRLGQSVGLRLSMSAHDWLDPTPPSAMNFYGSVVAGQIAAGDISNFVSFGELLEKAEAELDDLADVDEPTRSEAKGLLSALRGQQGAATTAVVGGAGGELLASILGQLIGLPS